MNLLFNWIDSWTSFEFLSLSVAFFFFVCWLEVKLKLKEYEKNAGGYLN